MRRKEPPLVYLLLFVFFLVFLVGRVVVTMLPFLVALAVVFLVWYLLGKGKLSRVDIPWKLASLRFMPVHVFPKLIILPLIVILVLVIFIKSVVIIPAGETGVYHLFGRVSDREMGSGLYLVNPLANVTKMSIRTEEYTMSIALGEGRRPQADSITALTEEGLTVNLDITVLFHLLEEEAARVFKTVGLDYEEKIIRPEIRSAIRLVIAQFETKAVYSEKRKEAALQILSELKSAIEPRGIAVEEVLLRNVQLPAKLAESIQEKLTAEQEAERMNFVLQKEKKEAERKRIEAEGQRDAQAIINESLSEKYLEYLYINSLKERQGTIYVPVNPENGLPLFKNLP